MKDTLIKSTIQVKPDRVCGQVERFVIRDKTIKLRCKYQRLTIHFIANLINAQRKIESQRGPERINYSNYNLQC